MSIMIATNANIIAENELKIQKANNQPIFVFDEIRYGNGCYEKLQVYNYGAPINKYSISPIVFITIDKEITIPILNYYPISFRSGNDSRELQTFYAPDDEQLNGNRYRYVETMRRFYEILQNDNSSRGILIHKYVDINYEDLYGENHNGLYIITDLYPHKVSNEEKEKILFDVQDSLNNGYSLYYNELTAEKVINILQSSH